MVKRYEPIVRKEYDLFDDYHYHEADMKESSTGQWVSLESHQQTVRDMNKLQKKLERYERRLNQLEGRTE